MKNKFLKVFFLLAFSSLCLVGCSGKTKEFEDTALPPTAEVGQVFDIDSSNSIIINGASIVTKDSDKILLMNYSWKNEGSNPGAVFSNFTLTASQGGVALQPTLEHTEDTKLLVTNISPGETIEGIEQGFILDSEEIVTISVLGNDYYWIKDNKPLYSYPVTVEMDLADVR